MATYLDKKWQLRIFYTTTPAGLTIAAHEARLYLNVTGGVDAGGEFGDYIVTARNASANDVSDYTGQLMDLIEPLFSPSASFSRAELWAADEGTEDWTFYSTQEIGHVGSSVVTMTPYISQILTFRNQNGNSMRLQLMETSGAAAPKEPFPYDDPDALALANFITAAASPVVNKRFAFAIASINNCIEQNEHLWDSRNR